MVGLLSVGSEKAPKDDVLQIGEAGSKQLVEVKDEGEKGLAAFFKKDNKNMAGVLGPGGMPPMPKNLGQNMKQNGGHRYEILKEQSYEGQ